MPPKCPPEFVRFAHRLADLAGSVHRRHFRREVRVEIKEDGSPVTEVDRETERLLREEIERAYPAHGIRGEEFGDHNPDAELAWIIDPLDGTKSFLLGTPSFALLLALRHEDRLVLGVIDQAVLRDRWLGADGHGTCLNAEQVRTRGCASLAQAVLLTDGPARHAPEVYRAVERARRAVRWTRYGLDAPGFGLLAAGRADLALDAGYALHDFAALEPVVRNAGGVLLDWSGRALAQGSDGTILAAGDASLAAPLRECLSAPT